jgi:glutathione S-transferase
MPVSQPEIKVHYFDIAGRAETTRLALHIGGYVFEDVRYSRPEWGKLKESGKFKNGQLPALEVDGKMFSQSNAMARYAGKLSGLYPSCPLEALRVDEVMDTLEDMMGSLVPTFRMQGEEQLAARAKWVADSVPKYFPLLQGLLHASSGLLLEGLSIGDLAVANMVQMVCSGWLDGIPPTVCDNYPALKQLVVKVNSHPKVAEWRAISRRRQIEGRAIKFFEACETSKGYEACKEFMTPDATFAAQSEPLLEIKTLKGYVEWMEGFGTTTCPGNRYDLHSVTSGKDTVVFFATFHGTHTGAGGPVDPTGKTTQSEYVYVLTFNPAGLISGMKKVWNAGFAMKELGWA